MLVLGFPNGYPCRLAQGACVNNKCVEKRCSASRGSHGCGIYRTWHIRRFACIVVGVRSIKLVVGHTLVVVAVVARIAALLCFRVVCWSKLDMRRRVAFFNSIELGTVRDGSAARHWFFLRDL